MKSIINWRIFFILLISSLLSVLAVFPYILTVQGEILKQISVSIPILFFIQLLQSAILFSIAIFLGLYLNRKIHFQTPFFDALVKHGDYIKVLKNFLSLSVLLGIITALLIFAIDFLFTLQGAAISTNQTLAPIWQTLLASFYGGITEEILMRLFLMTLFVFMGMKITRRSQPRQSVIMISIFLAAIIFGLGHLPITASLTNLTPLIITRAVVLNGIGGIIFGWLYWKKGLEAAMISHFTADIFLLTILPRLF